MKPIDPDWIRQYVDSLLALAERLGPGRMREVVLQRADHILDLVKAWTDHEK